MENDMSTLSLASLKKTFGITDEFPINYEKRGNELILHIPLKSTYHRNDEIINQARNLAHQRKKQGWTRQDFFADFMKVRDKVLEEVRSYYNKK
jgi:hypothetical protein